MRVDASDDGVTDLAADLERAGERAMKDARGVVAKGLLNIKSDARKRIGCPRQARAYPNSITYDTRHTATTARGEVGPDKARKQGALGVFFEYGSPRTAPRPHMGPAGDAERPRFEKALQDLAVRAVDP